MVNLKSVEKPAGKGATSLKRHVAIGEQVMSDKFEMSTGQAHEFALACARNGLTNEQVKKMSSGDFLKTILPVLLGTGIVQIVKYIVDLAGDCMPESWKKEGWLIEKHVGEGQLALDLTKIQLYLSANQIDGKVIKGNELRKELEKNKVSVLSACVLDHLLLHPELIPEDWKKDEMGKTRYVYFWGTVYRHQHGNLCVRYLFWLDGAWIWDYFWLGYDWSSQGPAAVFASTPQP
jgi:hypothetical protein